MGNSAPLSPSKTPDEEEEVEWKQRKAEARRKYCGEGRLRRGGGREGNRGRMEQEHRAAG